MEERSTKTIVEEIWPRVKKKHFYPEIPVPKIGNVADADDQEEKGEGVGLEIKQKQMTINPDFLAEMKDRLAVEDTIEALLDHGVTHYTFCPWDFHTYMTLYSEAKKVMGDKDLAKQVTTYFIDVVSDTHCVKEKATKIPELHRHLKRGQIGETLASLYEKIWGIDLGGSSTAGRRGRHGDVVRRLARIPYLDRTRWPDSIRKFARSVKPLFIEEEEKEKSAGGKSESNPLGDHDLENYSYDEIDQGLRDYAKESMALPEFREMVEDFSNELKEAGYGMEGGMGRGRGTPHDADIHF